MSKKKPPNSSVGIRLVKPDFDSGLMDVILKLNHLRRFELSGTTPPWLFFQLKEIFHLLESIGSARIEGNRTTLSEYIERQLEGEAAASEEITEINNIKNAIAYIEGNIHASSHITQQFVRELHHLVVTGLTAEGDKTPGAYRQLDVSITKSKHKPPPHFEVPFLMDELFDFIAHDHADRYDLIKTAIAHHRFVWIHPFGNGNGRVVRLFNYALLIKYGFRVKEGQIINPTAVFCNDREQYYRQLANADFGSDAAMKQWCEYALGGLLRELSKIYKLLDHQFLLNRILMPTLAAGRQRQLINADEEAVLAAGMKQGIFKLSDITKAVKMESRMAKHVLKNLKGKKMIRPLREGSRQYHVDFHNNYLVRGLIETLEKEQFITVI